MGRGRGSLSVPSALCPPHLRALARPRPGLTRNTKYSLTRARRVGSWTLSGHSVCRSGVPAPGRPPPAPPPAPTSSSAASSAVGLVPAESTESRSCSIAAPAAQPEPGPGADTDAVAAADRPVLGAAPPPAPPRPASRRDWLRLHSSASGSALAGPHDWLVSHCLPRLVTSATVHNCSRPLLIRKRTPRARPLPVYATGEGRGPG